MQALKSVSFSVEEGEYVAIMGESGSGKTTLLNLIAALNKPRGGSVTLCRTLQKDEAFYYRKRNFVSLSSLTYRMKRSGAGLTSICILSTMVLVMLASTASLYFCAEDAINTLAIQNHWQSEGIEEIRAEFFLLYGSLFFLGVTAAALLLFALLYCAMYRLTSNAYYRIVSSTAGA